MSPRYALIPVSTVLAALLGAGGCGDDSGSNEPGGTGGTGGIDAADASDGAVQPSADAAADAADAEGPNLDSGAPDAPGQGGPDASAGPCGVLSDRPVVDISADVTSAITWTCDKVYRLTTVVFVRSVLTIEPGTVVRGVAGDVELGKLPGALIGQREGTIRAVGTRELPIVFTSDKPAGSRLAGDWGGVAMLGRAPNNLDAGEAVLEGLPQDETRGVWGASKGAQDPAHDCGTLSYVRVEFAGFKLTSGKELNGITLAGCGFQTRIDHVQVHQGSDDGIEIFGGLVDVKHAVITGAQDDSIDWDKGYRGRMQFLAIQQYAEALFGVAPDNGFECDNDGTAPGKKPTSSPRIFNVTAIGASAGGGLGWKLRAGTHAFVRNAITLGFASGVLDIETSESAAAVATGELSFENSLFVGAAASPAPVLWPIAADGPDDGLVEADVFTAPVRGNAAYSDYAAVSGILPAPFDVAAPGWVPSTSSPAATGAATPSEAPPESGSLDAGPDPIGIDAAAVADASLDAAMDAPLDAVMVPAEASSGPPDVVLPPFFDTAASYRGAFKPGGPDWTAGWTAYPAN